MERRDKILYQCNLNGIGLEIGPSHSPILPKAEGYNVETLDHLDRNGLKEKYALHDVDVEKIEEVN